MKKWLLLVLVIAIGSILTYVGGLVWWYINSTIGHGMMFGSLFGTTMECIAIGKKWRIEKQVKK